MISRGRGDNSGRNIGTVRYRFVTAWLRQAGDDTDEGDVYRQALDIHSFDLWQSRAQFTKVKNGSAKTRFLLLGLGPYDVRTRSDVTILPFTWSTRWLTLVEDVPLIHLVHLELWRFSGRRFQSPRVSIMLFS